MDISEYARGCLDNETDDELSFYLKSSIWVIHGWSHNQINRRVLKKYEITHWAEIPFKDE